MTCGCACSSLIRVVKAATFTFAALLGSASACRSPEDSPSVADATAYDRTSGNGGLSARARAAALMRTYLAPEGVNLPPSGHLEYDPDALPPALGGETRWASSASIPRPPEPSQSELLRDCDLVRADAREMRRAIQRDHPAVLPPSPSRLDEARQVAEAVRARGIAAKSVAFASHMVFSVPTDDDVRVGWWRDRLAMRQQQLDDATDRVGRLRSRYELTGEYDAEAILFAAEVANVTREADALIEGACTVDWVNKMRTWLSESGERLTWREHGISWSKQVTGVSDRGRQHEARGR